LEGSDSFVADDYFVDRLANCRSGCTGVDDLFCFQASQVSMIILVAGFPGVDDSFWLQAVQVSMIYFGCRLPRCR
jgi:hypothetical protein